MAIYYIDLASGNDSTGDGSAGNPWKTINQAISAGGGPHDIRVAKTTASSTVGAATTLSWTYNSSRIFTSTDLTGSLAVDDLIGKPTAQGNGYSETFYRITAVSATEVTINSVYGGETGDTTGALKINPETVVSTGGIADFTATCSVSGGWDRTTLLQDGETWCKPDVLNENIFAISADDVSVSKINFVNCGGFVLSGDRGFTMNYCTIDGDGAIIEVRVNSSFSFTYCAITFGTTVASYALIIYNPPYSGEYHVFQNNYVVGNTTNKTGVYYNTTGLKGSDIILGGNTFIGLSAGVRMTSGSTLDLSTDVFYNCANGIAGSNNVNNTYMENGEFHDCTNGLTWGYSASHFITRARFYDCYRGIYSYQMKDLIVYDCYFESCDYGIYYEQNASGLKAINCEFKTPLTAAIAKQAPRLPAPQIINCTINQDSEIKAIELPSQLSTIYIGELPVYIIKNSFHNYPNGAYYSYWQLIEDNAVKMGALPSMRLSMNIFMDVNTQYWMPIMKYYVQSGNSYTFKIYIKSLEFWFGEIQVRWSMARYPIKYESTITSLPSDWTEYTWTISDSLVTENGVLAIEILYNGNANPIWFDRPTINGQTSSPFLFIDSANRLNDNEANDVALSDYYSGFYPLASGYINENQYQSEWHGNIS